MCKNIFYCKPLQNNSGYTWTIVSRLGDILSTAKHLYGPRDDSFTILGIEIANIRQPQIWFPGNRKDIAIQITPNCIENMPLAIFQVAHEAIHCLNPKINGSTTWLEEGLAAYFSRKYILKCGYDLIPGSKKYINAMNYVAKLLSYDNHIILNLRGSYEQDLSHISSELLLRAYPRIDKELATKLTSKF